MDPALFQENERTAPKEGERQVVCIGDLSLELGGALQQVQIAYETWGELSAAKDNSILICHALSGDSHAIGWWDRLVGPGRAFDTDRWFVIGSNCVGGCQGTTGPASLSPDDGRPYGSRFPQITVGDMVEAQIRLVQALGINELLCVAGGSMGGMQALEWTRRGHVRKAFVTGSCAAHNAMQIGFNHVARQAVMRDPAWQGGDYYGGPAVPDGGLAVARMLGHISFLSEAAFDAKFGRRLQKGQDKFQVESYLEYQGEKFTRRFDANSLLVLTRAIDLYECATLSGSQSEYLFTSFSSDWLYPSHQSQTMHQMALHAGCKSRWVDIDLPYGHDAFLLDGEHQGAAVRELLVT